MPRPFEGRIGHTACFLLGARCSVGLARRLYPFVSRGGVCVGVAPFGLVSRQE